MFDEDEEIEVTPAALTAEQIKAAESARIAEQTKAFLANGGKVISVPTNKHSHVEAYRRPATQQEDLALKKRLGLKASDNIRLYFRPEQGKWHAEFGLQFLGLFTEEADAENAIKAKALKVFPPTVTRHKLAG